MPLHPRSYVTFVIENILGKIYEEEQHILW
jgi:hypothetical protein